MPKKIHRFTDWMRSEPSASGKKGKQMMQQVESPHDGYLQDDLDRVAQSGLPFDRLRGKTVLVTGATGLVGVSLVRALACINRKNGIGMRILAMARNPEKAAAVLGPILNRQDVSLCIGDINASVAVTEPVDFIFHCAGVTASRTMVTQPVETILTSVTGTCHLLEFARQQPVQSFVYLSSMEMYGSFGGQSRRVTETDLGVLDPLQVRSNYPESKRLCENLCIAYLSEYGVPVKIARLAQTFGAGILPGENRVFAQFARCAMEKTDIVLHTTGQSEGNYCYLRDTVRALLLILLNGADGEAYNIVNEQSHTTIADMAHLVADQIAQGEIQVTFDIPESNIFGYAAETKMRLSADKLRQLGWEPEVGLKESYERMIGSMRCGRQTGGDREWKKF